MKESAIPVNAVGGVAPIRPGDTPPGITALQRVQRAAKRVRCLRKKTQTAKGRIMCLQN